MNRKNFSYKSKKVFNCFLNVLHVIIILLILVVVLRAVICVDTGIYNVKFWSGLKEAVLLAGLTEWLTFIGAIAFVLFGINGIYEFCYSNSISFLVPPFYRTSKEIILLKQAEKMMSLYYNNDIEFIKNYENERTNALLHSLKLSEKQFQNIRYEILKARAGSITNIQKLEEKAKDLLLDKSHIIDLTSVEAYNRVYQEVDCYLNLYTALYDPRVCDDACRLMTNFLKLKLDSALNDIDCIVIPYGGNLLLGLSVARQLNIHLISILEQGRMVTTNSWDGEYPAQEKNKRTRIIVLHDVLVSGERIYKSLDKLPSDSYDLLGVFSLVYYMTKNNPIKILEQNGISKEKLHSIITVTDYDIKKRLK